VTKSDVSRFCIFLDEFKKTK